MSLRHHAQIAVDDFGAAPVDPGTTDVHAMALARTTVNLFQRWRLDDAKARAILGGMAKPVWARWKKGRIRHPGISATKMNPNQSVTASPYRKMKTHRLNSQILRFSPNCMKSQA